MGKVQCHLCNVICNSPRSFCEHINSLKHKGLLSRSTPVNEELLGRIQYMLDTYMKLYPMLGLEYVEEREVDCTYLYTCTLCHVKHDWQMMIIHITDPQHNWNYINRHHHAMVARNKNMSTSLLTATIQKIDSKYGRKKIRIVKPDAHGLPAAAGTSSKGGGKKNHQPPPAGDRSGKPQQEAVHSESFAEDTKIPQLETVSYCCHVCSVTCSCPMALCQHILGLKHKQNLQALAPQKVRHMYRLSFFLSDYLNDVSILGLEYVVEEKEGTEWNHSCQLCDKAQLSLKKIFNHVTDAEHMMKYIRKHHTNLLPSRLTSFDTKKQLIKFLRCLSLRIVAKHGRKNVQVRGAGAHLAAPVQEAKPRTAADAGREGNELWFSKYDSEKSSRPKRKQSPEKESRDSYKKALKKSTVDDPPLDKRGRLCHEEDQEASTSRVHTSKPRDSHQTESQATLEATTAVQELEFHTNPQFLEYLASFRIDDDQDAAFIQQIIQNCITALTRFQKECERLEITSQHETPSASASWTVPETSEVSVNEVRSPSPDLETVLPVDNEDPSLERLPKNQVTDFFCSSFKDMDETEVVGVFEKIATTNPEFQGMDIPTVIRILKDSGRLKKS